MREQRFERWTDILVRLGYHPIKEGAYPASKVKQVELLAYLLGMVDEAQVYRCGLYPSISAVYVAFSQALRSKSVLSPAMLPDSACAVFSVKKNADKAKCANQILSLLSPEEQDVFQKNQFQVKRLHELFAVNVAAALIYSRISAFSLSMNHTLFRGASTICDMMERQNDYCRTYNELAPDLTARLEIGSCFVEIDRGNEGTVIFNRKIADYLETLQSLSVRELSSVSVMFSCFGTDGDVNRFVRGRKSTMSSYGVDALMVDCVLACQRRKDSFSLLCDTSVFRVCAEGGLRLFLLPGNTTWDPSVIDSYLLKESGVLGSIESGIARCVGRNYFNETVYGSQTLLLANKSITCPVAITSNSSTKADELPIIFEHLSYDLCARHRIVEILTSRDFIVNSINSPDRWSFLVITVCSEQEASVFMNALSNKILTQYENDPVVATMLHKASLYCLYGVRKVGADSFEFDLPHHGFVFRCEDKLFLPKMNDTGFFVNDVLIWKQTTEITPFSY